jgi:hypothetical protein
MFIFHKTASCRKAQNLCKKKNQLNKKLLQFPMDNYSNFHRNQQVNFSGCSWFFFYLHWHNNDREL